MIQISHLFYMYKHKNMHKLRYIQIIFITINNKNQTQYLNPICNTWQLFVSNNKAVLHNVTYSTMNVKINIFFFISIYSCETQEYVKRILPFYFS